jgi:hypothetical protein
VKIEILHVSGCPNVDLLDRRLVEALAGRPAVVTHTPVPDLDTAATAGMAGSPTLLLDGADPFTRDGIRPSMSCRLYVHENGHVDGAPSVDDLRRVLG